MQYALFSWKIVLDNDETKKYELQYNNGIMIRWVSGCCEMPNEQVCRYIMVTTSYIQWDGDDVHFVLDQYDELDFGSASSLKQHTMSLLDHIILILSQPVSVCVLNGKPNTAPIFNLPHSMRAYNEMKSTKYILCT